MQFQAGHTYHIYNQGNNWEKIFFNRENYLFFYQENPEICYALWRYFGVMPNAESFSFDGGG